MKRTSIVILAALGCALIVFLSAHPGGHTHNKLVNPYFARFQESIRTCERRNVERREAEDQAREAAWKKYGERVSRTDLGHADCTAEAWENVQRLPFAERVEARRQIELAA